MNITNEQPTAPKVRTMPEYAEWTHNGLTHFLGGLEERNIEAYKRVIADNDDNKVVALAQIMNIKNVLLRNVAESWEVSENDASKILGSWNLYNTANLYTTKNEESFRSVIESELRKLCKKTNIGEELADMLLQM